MTDVTDIQLFLCRDFFLSINPPLVAVKNACLLIFFYLRVTETIATSNRRFFLVLWFLIGSGGVKYIHLDFADLLTGDTSGSSEH